MAAHAVNALRRVDLHAVREGKGSSRAFRLARSAADAAERLADGRADVFLRGLVDPPCLGHELQPDNTPVFLSKPKRNGLLGRGQRAEDRAVWARDGADGLQPFQKRRRRDWIERKSVMAVLTFHRRRLDYVPQGHAALPCMPTFVLVDEIVQIALGRELAACRHPYCLGIGDCLVRIDFPNDLYLSLQRHRTHQAPNTGQPLSISLVDNQVVRVSVEE